MYSCHSILECSNLFSGVKLSIRSFGFIRRCIKNRDIKKERIKVSKQLFCY